MLNKNKIIELLQLNLPVEKLNRITGYNKLLEDIKIYQDIIFKESDKYLIPEIAKLIASSILLFPRPLGPFKRLID